MRALLAPKTEPVGWPVRWTVYREGEPGRILYDARAANPTLPVPAGRYVVEARDGQAMGSLTVDVGDTAPTIAGVPLNAGTLAVKAIAQRTGAPLTDATISISDAGQAADGKPTQGAPVAFFKGAEGSATCRRAATWCASSRGWCAPSARSWCRPAARAASRFP